MKEITVSVEADGSIKIGAKGFKGADCTKATAELEKALGVVTKDTRTPEFYQKAQNPQQREQGQ